MNLCKDLFVTAFIALVIVRYCRKFIVSSEPDVVEVQEDENKALVVVEGKEEEEEQKQALVVAEPLLQPWLRFAAPCADNSKNNNFSAVLVVYCVVCVGAFYFPNLIDWFNHLSAQICILLYSDGGKVLFLTLKISDYDWPIGTKAKLHTQIVIHQW